MSRLRAFALFWWNLVIGDDWMLAAGVAVLLCAVAALARGGVAAWWLAPPAVLALLALSVRRALRTP